MRGLAILLSFYLIGLVFQKWLHIPLPSNVIGLALFTICLFTGFIKLKWVEQTASYLNRHMLLFFVPIIVGTMTFVPFLREHAVSLLVTLVGSWLAVLLTTGWTVKSLTNGSKETAPTNHSMPKHFSARRNR